MRYKIVGVLKGVFKDFANFTGKYRYNVNVKVWLYAFTLHLNFKKTHTVVFREFCRSFKKAFLLEHSWTIASDFFMFDIFKSNNTRKLVFYLPFFTENQSKKVDWL